MRRSSAALWGVVMLAGCRNAPELSYRVTLERPGSDTLQVALELRDLEADSLVLGAVAAADVFQPLRLQVSGPRREPIAVRTGLRATGGAT